MSRGANATVGNLYGVPDKGKAEIFNGELIPMAPTGGVPARAGGEIYVSLYGKADAERRENEVYVHPAEVGWVARLADWAEIDCAANTARLSDDED
jgi:hypothetical protein